MTNVLKSENSEKNSYEISPINSLDLKKKGRKRKKKEMKDRASFPTKLATPHT